MMVFSGKPSRGCENCRKLHTKCDEKLPACSRCLRMKKKCSGYRDQSDLMFRDETVKMEQKFRPRRSLIHGYQTRPSHEAKFSSSGVTTLQKSRENHRTHVAYPLKMSHETVAICYFYHNTLGNMSEKDPARLLHALLPMIYSTSRPGSALCLATEAISYIASMKLVSHASQLSQKKYVQAIRSLGKAIQDPLEVESDETLYAILLLGGYETMIRDCNTLPAWGAHVDGAATVLKLRRSIDVNSFLSRRLYYFARKNVVLSSMQKVQPVDEIFTIKDNNISLHDSPEDELVLKASAIPTLQHSSNIILSSARIGNTQEIVHLVRQAEHLDQQLSQWTVYIPTDWSYTIALNINPASNLEFTLPRVHRYADYYTARVWNFYRVSRLIIQSILLRATSYLYLELGYCPGELDTKRIETNILELVNDICASVPFLSGENSSKVKGPADIVSSGHISLTASSPRIGESGTEQSGIFSLVWPLHVASSAPIIPKGQQEWMRKQLRLIAAQGEIQAQIIQDIESQTLLGGAEEFRFDCV